MTGKRLIALAAFIILLLSLTGCGSSNSGIPTAGAGKNGSQNAKYYQVPKGLLYPVTMNNKLGFINEKGQMIVQPTYDKQMWQFGPAQFSDGLACVKLDGKYGYINTKGELVIKPQFNAAEPFSEGLASVQGGYIDKQGKMVIPEDFMWAGPFSEGLATVLTVADEKWGVIDKTGKMVLQPEVTQNDGGIGPFKQGLAKIHAKNGKWGFIDTKGNMVIPARFDQVSDFSCGRAFASCNDEAGYIDKTGKMVFKLRNLVSSGTAFSEGLAPVESDIKGVKRCGYIDTSGKLVIERKYLSGYSFKYGLAAVMDPESRKLGVIDTNGNVVIPLKYEWVDVTRGALIRGAISDADDNYEWLDRSGKVVWRSKTAK